MNNILVVFASPNINGTTGQALNNYIKKNGLVCNYFYNCYEKLPLPCFDCGYCKKVFSCKNTDLDDFYAAFENADNVLIAFPVYNSSFPAPLKALIDRMQIYYNARFCRNQKPPIKIKKKVTIISVSGSPADYKEIILSQLTPVFTITNCTLADYISIKNTDNI